MVADLPSSRLAEVDPRFETLALETARLTFRLPGTSLREKLLQNLVQDVCRAQLGLALRMHVTAAKMHAISYADLLAAIRFIAPYVGYPAAADALDGVHQLAIEIGMDTANLDDPSAPHPDDEPAACLDAADDWMTMFVQSRTTRAWSEQRLSRREKAILAITADVSQQTLDNTFRWHVKLALDAGLTTEEVRDVVRFCAEHSLARTGAALRELSTVLGESVRPVISDARCVH